MSCGSCTSSCLPEGCGNKGHCASGGCNKKNSFDWLANMSIEDDDDESLLEVTFRNGTRKGIYTYTRNQGVKVGNYVTVEAKSGHDVGKVTLTGTLARLQLKKHKKEKESSLLKVYRLASKSDLDKLTEARKKEPEILMKARIIAKSMDLKMKIGDVEYQADKKKLTLYYTSDKRIDFRAILKVYINEFHGKIEMKQIGDREEAGLIGGIGQCGRELCCSTWLSSFKSVSTNSARYQNLSINTDRISGQCGRLKCCLNYELDTYMDALSEFPKNLKYLISKKGKAWLIKTDILKKQMFFSYSNSSDIIKLNLNEVKGIINLSKKNEMPEDLKIYNQNIEKDQNEQDFIGQINIKSLESRSRQKRKKKRKERRRN
jgi:cell fate regulator YaaT (PSP1 superfamily)